MKILSYNIQEGGAGRLGALAAVIARARPDAVALLEANDRAGAEALAARLGLALAYGEGNCAAHVAWLGRAPLLAARNHRHPGLAKTLLQITIAWDGAPLDLFAAHLASRHEPPTPAEEVPIVLALLARHAAPRHLLCGDFNALRPGEPVGTPPPGVAPRGEALPGVPRPALAPLLAAGYLDCYRARHPRAPGYTYPASAPWLRLDYLFASPALAPRLLACDRHTGALVARASDHLPIAVTFR